MLRAAGAAIPGIKRAWKIKMAWFPIVIIQYDRSGRRKAIIAASRSSDRNSFPLCRRIAENPY